MLCNGRPRIERLLVTAKSADPKAGTSGTPASKGRLFEWRVRDRLRDDGLLMVKAAPKSDGSHDYDGESHKDTHGSFPL